MATTVKANFSVRGVDLEGIVAGAREMLAQLSDGPWTIDSIDLNTMGGPESDVATVDGMLPMYWAYVSASTELKEG